MRATGALLLAVAGFLTSLATVAVHQSWWGLLLGLVATGLALQALDRGWATRLPFGLGWAALVALVAPTRPEGDFVLSASTSGYAVVLAAVAVVGWSVGTLPRPRGARFLGLPRG